MMITVSELEAIIAQTPSGEQVQYEGKPIGSVGRSVRWSVTNNGSAPKLVAEGGKK